MDCSRCNAQTLETTLYSYCFSCDLIEILVAVPEDELAPWYDSLKLSLRARNALRNFEYHHGRPLNSIEDARAVPEAEWLGKNCGPVTVKLLMLALHLGC